MVLVLRELNLILEIIFGNAENLKFLIASPTRKIHEL